jgi:hypothetical protein
MKASSDKDIVEIQLRRKVRSRVDVRSRCHFNLPTVTLVPPNLDDGTPFPTTYWLTCPLLVKRVSSLEAKGMVKVFDELIQQKGKLRRLWKNRQKTYEEERRLLQSSSENILPEGGVGGTKEHIKCLHTHLADQLATGKNPIGETIESLIGGFDCLVPCVKKNNTRMEFNSEWKSIW